MSARLPRRVFATPFVVTLAACGGGDAPPRDPTTPTETANTATPTNPPAPNPPLLPSGTASASVERPPSQDRIWTVMQTGTACSVVPKVDCSSPPGGPAHTCNPPPATSYECPKGVEIKGPATIVQAAGGSGCVLDRATIYPDMSQVKCPKGASCNPPPPQYFDPVPVPCPKP